MDYIITESQLKLLIEDNSEEKGMSLKLRRRLADALKHTKQDLEWYVDDEMDPCQFMSVGDFVAEACDLLKDLYIDNIFDIKVSPKDNDSLYYYFVENYGSQLEEIYYRKCVNGYVTESKENKKGKHLVNYLDSLDYSKVVPGRTGIEVYLKSEEFPPIYDSWSEDYVDKSGNVRRRRLMSLTDEMYQKLLMLFGMTPDELSEEIVKWFNNKFNENVDRLSNSLFSDEDF